MVCHEWWSTNVTAAVLQAAVELLPLGQVRLRLCVWVCVWCLVVEGSDANELVLAI